MYKSGLNHEEKMGMFTRILLNFLKSSPYLYFLEELIGIKDIMSDPHYTGSGIHFTNSGGSLDVHAYFNKLGRFASASKSSHLLESRLTGGVRRAFGAMVTWYEVVLSKNCSNYGTAGCIFFHRLFLRWSSTETSSPSKAGSMTSGIVLIQQLDRRKSARMVIALDLVTPLYFKNQLVRRFVQKPHADNLLILRRIG